MPNKCFASWASPNWTRPLQRRDKNRSCSDQPQNPPPYLLGVTGHNVKHALEQYEENPYAVRLRLRFVLKRRLHQDSIEAQTRYQDGGMRCGNAGADK